jgi:hypothetical protein
VGNSGKAGIGGKTGGAGGLAIDGLIIGKTSDGELIGSIRGPDEGEDIWYATGLPLESI